MALWGVSDKKTMPQGFLIIDDYFDTSLLEPVKKSIAEQVDSLVNVMCKAGKIKGTCT